ncbi:MAG: aminopeptidase N [Deltaproteobacteria bacterium]|nr:aminopeptidase N [Deltaproteobacteria bacterium]
MSQDKPKAVYRNDYRVPDYWIERVDLHIELDPERTRVRSKLVVRRNEDVAGDPAPFALVGEDLKLLELRLDGRELGPGEYRESEGELVVEGVPARFEFETLVEINPRANTALSGLYLSSGNYCTQCEAMGFRRITWYLDRPDVMARFTTTLVGDPEQIPVMLSNGNLVADERLEDGRRSVRWEDPFPKPSYLFALVAGDLRCHAGSFTTRSGREVKLEIWVEPQNLDRCEHALRSLQKSMQWDEERFGLEYDLDVYMIVAVNDFNMGAMENKGLNVFNSKYVLAQPETATDDDYEGIEAVIGHEYFHNWTGNRVTCRDWFQLTLKEGLTVFRDQEFSADMTSAAVKRIDEVKLLRSAQFAEDAGPMAHPIRPESYISMDNFYTSTVYNKGAEVIRMVDTLLGREGFRRGMDLYFERHDGQAVTCDDFRAAMADANGADLAQFERWYSQAGTPVVEAEGSYDEEAGSYALRLRQSYPDPEEGVALPEREPLHIPVALGLIGAQGEDLPQRLAGEGAGEAATDRVLELKQAEQTFTFVGLDARPVPSLLRNFSAPVKLRMQRDRAELAFLMGHDRDAFNRWDAGQNLASELLLELSAEAAAGRELVLDPLFVEAWGRVLADPELDGSLKALALGLPSEKLLGQELAVVDVDALHRAREFALRELASAHRAQLWSVYESCATEEAYTIDRASIARRRLKNTALGVLSALGEDEVTQRIARQFRDADNMTDRQAALVLLVDGVGPEREEALAEFYERWKGDPLVLDKWFAVQALSKRPDTLTRVLELFRHPDFSLKNPNRLRSLVGSFCAGNQVRFHAAEGAGYAFLADIVLDLDALNPQMAARMVSIFNPWRRFDPGRRALMESQLERIASRKGLSKDVFEIVGRARGR